MHTTRFIIPILAFGLAPGLKADFTYNSTTQMTGGSLLKMMTMLSNKPKEPVAAVMSIKGNRMVHKTAGTVQIIDLDKETITHVNLDKKTYSLMTFAQMKEAMANMQDKMSGSKSGDVQADFKVSANETGQSKTIAGFEAKEMLVKIEVTGTSAQNGASGAMTMNSDMWIARNVPGYGEMREFQKRMALKLDWSPMSSPLAMRPDMAKGMSELYKQAGKMDGLPVMQVMKMGVAATGDSAAAPSTASAPAGSTRSTATSPSDAIASALGGKFGMGRKKSNASTDAPDASSSSDSLMEMTTQVDSVSSAPADPSLFEIPAGFKEVQDTTMQRGRKR